MKEIDVNVGNAVRAVETTGRRVLEDLSVTNPATGTRFPATGKGKPKAAGTSTGSLAGPVRSDAAAKAQAPESAAAKAAREMIERMQGDVAEVEADAPQYLGRNLVATREGDFIVLRILASDVAKAAAPKSGGGKTRILASSGGNKSLFGMKIGVNVMLPL